MTSLRQRARDIDVNRLGTVTRRRDNHAVRGVVVWRNGRGLMRGFPMPPAADEVVIQISAGIYRHTTYHDEWEDVPADEWTDHERVLAATARWTTPDWIDEGTAVPDNDTFEFAVLRALLRPDEDAEVFGEHHWPVSYVELALAVADCLAARAADLLGEPPLESSDG